MSLWRDTVKDIVSRVLPQEQGEVDNKRGTTLRHVLIATATCTASESPRSCRHPTERAVRKDPQLLQPRLKAVQLLFEEFVVSNPSAWKYDKVIRCNLTACLFALLLDLVDVNSTGATFSTGKEGFMGLSDVFRSENIPETTLKRVTVSALLKAGQAVQFPHVTQDVYRTFTRILHSAETRLLYTGVGQKPGIPQGHFRNDSWREVLPEVTGLISGPPKDPLTSKERVKLEIDPDNEEHFFSACLLHSPELGGSFPANDPGFKRRREISRLLDVFDSTVARFRDELSPPELHGLLSKVLGLLSEETKASRGNRAHLELITIARRLTVGLYNTWKARLVLPTPESVTGNLSYSAYIPVATHETEIAKLKSLYEKQTNNLQPTNQQLGVEYWKRAFRTVSLKFGAERSKVRGIRKCLIEAKKLARAAREEAIVHTFTNFQALGCLSVYYRKFGWIPELEQRLHLSDESVSRMLFSARRENTTLIHRDLFPKDLTPRVPIRPVKWEKFSRREPSANLWSALQNCPATFRILPEAPQSNGGGERKAFKVGSFWYPYRIGEKLSIKDYPILLGDEQFLMAHASCTYAFKKWFDDVYDRKELLAYVSEAEQRFRLKLKSAKLLNGDDSLLRLARGILDEFKQAGGVVEKGIGFSEPAGDAGHCVRFTLNTTEASRLNPPGCRNPPPSPTPSSPTRGGTIRGSDEEGDIANKESKELHKLLRTVGTLRGQRLQPSLWIPRPVPKIERGPTVGPIAAHYGRRESSRWKPPVFVPPASGMVPDTPPRSTTTGAMEATVAPSAAPGGGVVGETPARPTTTTQRCRASSTDGEQSSLGLALDAEGEFAEPVSLSSPATDRWSDLPRTPARGQKASVPGPLPPLKRVRRPFPSSEPEPETGGWFYFPAAKRQRKEPFQEEGLDLGHLAVRTPEKRHKNV